MTPHNPRTLCSVIAPVAACPFCDPDQERKSTALLWFDPAAEYDLPFQVICSGCGARGPLSLSSHRATSSWRAIAQSVRVSEEPAP